MRKLALEDLPDEELRGRRVLVRVDYNVPLEAGRIADETRITATLPTLRYLLERDARLILVSHLGRPKGGPSAELSLAPVAERLGELLDARVRFCAEAPTEEGARKAAESLGDGEVLVLENIRFLPGEEKNEPEVSEALAGLADVYVNDAFGAAHRAHASTAGVAQVIRDRGRPAVAGMLMRRELEYLGGALERPERPFVAVLGGAKISGKIDVIESLLPVVDRLLIGGAMANTFFRALGLETGRSLVEEERVAMARDLVQRAGAKLVLPVDARTAAEPDPAATPRVVDRDAVPPDAMILDIGPATEASFRGILEDARTVVWNGPMGMFEVAPFAAGTRAVAAAVAGATSKGATTVLGGGDTAAAAQVAGVADAVSHISTGGGASLEFLEGKTLPGVAALSDGGLE